MRKFFFIVTLGLSLTAFAGEPISQFLEASVEAGKNVPIRLDNAISCKSTVELARNHDLKLLGGVSAGAFLGYIAAQKALASTVQKYEKDVEIYKDLLKAYKTDGESLKAIAGIQTRMANNLNTLERQMNDVMDRTANMRLRGPAFEEFLKNQEPMGPLYRRIDALKQALDNPRFTGANTMAGKNLTEFNSILQDAGDTFRNIGRTSTKWNVELAQDIAHATSGLSKSRFMLSLTKFAPKLAAFLGGSIMTGIDLMTYSPELAKGTVSHWFTEDENLFGGQHSSEEICQAYGMADKEDKLIYEQKIGAVVSLVHAEAEGGVPAKANPPGAI